jgi:prepilin-type N-terminal cleavage/methylation domain-containing protein/prepilin-type processing-associated H-X9-DG protein
MSTRGLPKAFTIIELLVCIAIIGSLVTLVMPAVQSAREASRKIDCSNRMRQIGLAVHAYETGFRQFPIGCIGCKFATPQPGQAISKQRFLSWNIQILPFLDQRRLHLRFNFNLPSYQPPNKEAGSTFLSLFLCPSAPESLTKSSVGLWKGMAFTDFAGIYGVEGTGRNSVIPGAVHYLENNSLGVMLYEEPVMPQQIDDGLSNTALIGEALLRRRTESEWANGHNLFAQEQSTPINHKGLGNELGSGHPQGASVVFCDGHIQFLSEALDQATLNALLTKSGNEYFKLP